MPRNTQSNRGSSNRGRSKNNNPEGYNQYSSGWTDTARERPFATAAAAAAAVGASVFLWSRRSQISEQISNLSDQIGEWSESINSRSSADEFEMAGGESRFGGSAGNQFGAGSGPASSIGTTPSTQGAAAPTNFAAKRSGKSGRTTD